MIADLHVNFVVSSGELGSHLRQMVVLSGWGSSDILFHIFGFELVSLYFFHLIFSSLCLSYFFLLLFLLFIVLLGDRH